MSKQVPSSYGWAMVAQDVQEHGSVGRWLAWAQRGDPVMAERWVVERVTIKPEDCHMCSEAESGCVLHSEQALAAAYEVPAEAPGGWCARCQLAYRSWCRRCGLGRCRYDDSGAFVRPMVPMAELLEELIPPAPAAMAAVPDIFGDL